MSNQFFQKPDLFSARRVLCVQPHPDDMDLSIGGTVRRLTERGVEVHYLTVTDDTAEFTKAGSTLRDRADIRKDEQMKAGKLLGVAAYHWLDLPDAGDWSCYEARNGIIDVIRKVKPDALLTVDPELKYEAHGDHLKTGRAAMEAVLLYNFPHVGGKMPEDYEPFELSMTGFVWTNNPNTVVDTTEFNEIKFEAAAQHRSQFPTPEGLAQIKAYLSYRASVDAADEDFALGEPLKLLPAMMLHCFPEAAEF